MSRLAEFRALEQQLAAQLAELEALKNDDSLKKEIEFEQKLRDLLGEYGYSLRNVIAILDPQAATRRAPSAVETKGNRKPRQVKQYKNPHTGEVIETKGGNHKQLKEWKAEHGAEEVESWLAK
ncbi:MULTISPECIES: histone-like nucleoid-structuring protein, MvaT/MvaU family [Pseudomonas]|uniref:Transcriptional regulator n=1 Tax=Pseudomonas putida TaxID=303 RepID=A0A7V8ED61_PSEPU|nr:MULTISPECIES: histone-like nucleoid-structuring protein, MvaT/MvaU family [Pseudomonas]KAF0252007.1 transcriptional regulator [Pseudomonas putida]MCK2123890.1 DNA binding protein [Pseudomonas sp. PNPG3]